MGRSVRPPPSAAVNAALNAPVSDVTHLQNVGMIPLACVEHSKINRNLFLILEFSCGVCGTDQY